MGREVSCDLAAKTNHSETLDTLKSRYSCIHEPQPAAAPATPDDRRYLTSLWVFKNQEVDGPESPLPPSFSSLMVDQNIIDPHMIKEKITSALKVLKFREQHVLVQFWSPVAVRKRWLLSAWDQPFGLGVADEELYLYRLKSERRAIVVDAEHREKLDPPGRVYSLKLPEWSLDVHGQDTCYNNHGYITLPVFESSSDRCVGVLEIITSSSYVDFAFEVQEISRALKNQNLKSPNVFEDPHFGIADERRRNELDEIFKVLKTVCDNHNLPLAHTWAPSGYSSYVANSENIKQSCSSFNRSCIGKVCMSTADLPFYVRDLNLWKFHEACRKRHLHKSQGVVGRSLSSCGTWFCEDVTALDEDDYPLVHIARICGLTSCLAIYLKSLEVDVEHVIELFLPTHIANEIGIRRLMETVKQHIKNSSWMQIDIASPPQVIGGVSFNWNFESPPSPITLLTERGEVQPTKSENMENEPSNSDAGRTSQSVVPYTENKVEDFDINPGKTSRKRKRLDRMLSYEEISKHFGKTISEAATILNVSRSTLKRHCRNVGMLKWPSWNCPYKSAADSSMKSDQTNVGAFTSSFGGTTYTTHKPTALTKNGQHSSTHLTHQQEQTSLPDEFVHPRTAIRGKFFKRVENMTIKERYGENTIKFTDHLLDKLLKLEGRPIKKLSQLLSEAFTNTLPFDQETPTNETPTLSWSHYGDTLMESDETDVAVRASEGALTEGSVAFNEPFGGTTHITHDHTVLTEGLSELPSEPVTNILPFAQETPTNETAFVTSDMEPFIASPSWFHTSDADTLMESDETEVAVRASEEAFTQVSGAFNEPFGGTTHISHDPAVHNEGLSEFPWEPFTNTLPFAQETPTDQIVSETSDMELACIWSPNL